MLKRAFEKVGLPTTLHFVSDGQEVIDYLLGAGQFADRALHPLPDLLLLDLKMPRVDGFQVLSWVRQQPGLKRVPAVIFSSSGEEEDVNQAYDLGANSYLMKPHESEELLGIVEKLKKYWGDTNKPPNPQRI